MLDEGLLMIRDNTVKDSLINSMRWMMVNGLNKYSYSGDCSSSLSCCVASPSRKRLNFH